MRIVDAAREAGHRRVVDHTRVVDPLGNHPWTMSGDRTHQSQFSSFPPTSSCTPQQDGVFF